MKTFEDYVLATLTSGEVVSTMERVKLFTRLVCHEVGHTHTVSVPGSDVAVCARCLQDVRTAP